MIFFATLFYVQNIKFKDGKGENEEIESYYFNGIIFMKLYKYNLEFFPPMNDIKFNMQFIKYYIED